MRLPRDLAGPELARLLARYDYQITRQTGSHMRLTSMYAGSEHHVTIPRHRSLRVGTLAQIVNEVSGYLGLDRDIIMEQLFGR